MPERPATPERPAENPAAAWSAWRKPRDTETMVFPAVGSPAGDQAGDQVEDQTEVILKAKADPQRTVPARVPVPRQRQPDRGTPPGDRRRRTIALPVLGLAAELLALSAVGVVLVAVGYVGGRAGVSYAGVLYWAGQVLVYTPVMFRLLSRRLTGVTESFLLVMGLAVNQYLLKWMYSPDQFRFPDELQHWLSTNIVVETGRLFQPNTALPVAAHFPGLEEIGAAVVSLTGLPVTAAGLLVAGVLHLLFVGTLFMMVRSAGGSPPLAGATCAIYATALHYLFFDSMYIYQTAALPFLILSVWATRTWRWNERGFAPYALVGVMSIGVVAVSHHITAMAMVATLSLLALCDLVLPGRPRRWSSLALAVTSLVIVTAWVVFVANEVYGYLQAPFQSLLAAVSHLFTGAKSTSRSVAPGNPLWELTVEALGLLCLLVLLARASWTAIRTRERDAWQWAVLVGAVLFFATSALRFVGLQGPELAGRASTFTYVPMSMLAAATIADWRRSLRPRAWPGLLSKLTVDAKWARPAPLGAAMATLLMVGARAGGWPPYWEQLPGPYLVSGFERSVDEESVATAQWTLGALGERNRIAADSTGATLASTYGRQEALGEASTLYYDPIWGLRDQQTLESLAVDYLWVDLRMSQQLPASGAYFPVDPDAQRHTTPIPFAHLVKFNYIPGVSRVYDSGNIQIYDMRRA